MFMHRCKECADRLKRSQLVFAQCSFLFKGRKKKKGKKNRSTTPGYEQTAFTEVEVVQSIATP